MVILFSSVSAKELSIWVRDWKELCQERAALLLNFLQVFTSFSNPLEGKSVKEFT